MLRSCLPPMRHDGQAIVAMRLAVRQLKCVLGVVYRTDTWCRKAGAVHQSHAKRQTPIASHECPPAVNSFSPFSVADHGSG